MSTRARLIWTWAYSAGRVCCRTPTRSIPWSPMLALRPPPGCLDRSDVDLLHRHHRLVRAFCLTANGRKCVHQRAGGDLPGEAPAVLAPTALAFLAAIANDRVPVAICFFLIVRRDLKGEGLGVLEVRTAVETEAWNAEHGELYRQHITLLTARVVTGRLVDSGHFAIRKGGGVEARRVLRVLVEPETDCVLWLHVRMLLVLDDFGECTLIKGERP